MGLDILDIGASRSYTKKTIEGEGAIKGDPGIGIVSIEQTTEATGSGGVNIVTVTKTDGTKSEFNVRNGEPGATIDSAQINTDGELIQKMSDGREVNAGKVPVVKEENGSTMAISKKENNALVEEIDGYYVPTVVLTDYAKTEEVDNSLKDKVDKVEGKSLVDDTEIERLSKIDNYNDQEVKEIITVLNGNITAVEESIEKLNADTSTEGSVDYKIAQAIATIMENPDDTINSINELVTWINNHAIDALTLSNKVSANEKALDDKQDTLSGVAGQYVGFNNEGKAMAVDLTIDTELNAESTNSIANKVVTAKFAEIYSDDVSDISSSYTVTNTTLSIDVTDSYDMGFVFKHIKLGKVHFVTISGGKKIYNDTTGEYRTNLTVEIPGNFFDCFELHSGQGGALTSFNDVSVSLGTAKVIITQIYVQPNSTSQYSPDSVYQFRKVLMLIEN